MELHFGFCFKNTIHMCNWMDGWMTRWMEGGWGCNLFYAEIRALRRISCVYFHNWKICIICSITRLIKKFTHTRAHQQHIHTTNGTRKIFEESYTFIIPIEISLFSTHYKQCAKRREKKKRATAATTTTITLSPGGASTSTSTFIDAKPKRTTFHKQYCNKIINTLVFHIMITSLVFIKHK